MKDYVEGPWEAFDNGYAHDICCKSDISDTISRYSPSFVSVQENLQHSHTKGKDREKATAQLVAAAPEMLEALEDLREQIKQVECGDRPYTGFDTELLDHATSKAKGEL